MGAWGWLSAGAVLLQAAALLALHGHTVAAVESSSDPEKNNAAPPDAGKLAAVEAWRWLGRLARGDAGLQGGGPDWSSVQAALVAAHPHPEASGALAWLYLFGVPDAKGEFEPPGGFPRDVDAAVLVARGGAGLQMPTCGRCHVLLGLLLGLGYPPLVHVAHTTVDRFTGQPSLIIAGSEAKALPSGSAAAARLPRDVGRPDPVAAAYVLGAHAGDPLGLLALTYLQRRRMINATTFNAPGANQASSVLPRKPKEDAPLEPCDPTLVALLGEQAGAALDAMREEEDSWGPLPLPLASHVAEKRDRAWLQHVLSDPAGAAPGDLVEVADLVESGEVSPADLPRISKSPVTALELRRLAAHKGSAAAALRVAVEHLKRNESKEAGPLLHLAAAGADASGDEGEAEMARYYLRRFADDRPDAAAAWQHLVRAADVGREDAALLVAHAHAGGGESVPGAPKVRNASEAMRRYRRIAGAGGGGGAAATRGGSALGDLQAFAAYNLGVLALQEEAAKAASNASNATSGVGAGTQPGASPSAAAADGEAPRAGSASADAGAPTTGGEAATASPAVASGQRRALEAASESLLQLGPPCSLEALRNFEEVVRSRHPAVRLLVAQARRAHRVGDSVGALLLSALLSDLGHPLGHADAAFLWDRWAQRRPPHLGPGSWEPEADPETGAPSPTSERPCNLSGWWTTSTQALAEHNISRAFVSPVEGGGFEMFNASLDGTSSLGGLGGATVVIPEPVHSQFRHLHSFLWHTTYDALPGGGPVPVALQPPGAVPHLVEQHHQRGKLSFDKRCNEAHVEGMFVNWTFHRLDAASPAEEPAEVGRGRCGGQAVRADGSCDEGTAAPGPAGAAGPARRDFLHCWARPANYFEALEGNLAAARRSSAPRAASGWEALVALTTSSECPCHGAFACRRGDGACVQASPLEEVEGLGDSTAAPRWCPVGSTHCTEVTPDLEPLYKPAFASSPEVCGLAYHRRAAVDGIVDSMHVLSHAYSNGLRGAPKDAAEALRWSRTAMEAGDARGRFDVAYSLEFGLGTEADPEAAYAIYKDLLQSRGEGEAPFAAKASSLLALLSASGRYLAGRLLGAAGPAAAPPWAAGGHADGAAAPE